MLARCVGVLLGDCLLTKCEEVDQALTESTRAGFCRTKLGEHCQEASRHLLVALADAGKDIGQRSLNTAKPKLGGAVGQGAASCFTARYEQAKFERAVI